MVLTSPPAPAPAPAAAATAARPSLRAQIAENPLQSLFGLIVVALLAAAVAGPNIRINDTNERLDRIEDRLDRLEAKFDELDAKFDELDRKLTALIAHLNATSAVDDALEGRLTGMSDDTPGMGNGTAADDP